MLIIIITMKTKKFRTDGNLHYYMLLDMLNRSPRKPSGNSFSSNCSTSSEISTSSCSYNVDSAHQDYPTIIDHSHEDLEDKVFFEDLSYLEKNINEDAKTWTREDRVRKIMCRQLTTIGYRHTIANMYNTYTPMGYPSDVRVPYRVRPIKEFVRPLTKIENLWIKNEKAIEMIATWPKFDKFFQDWKQVSDKKDNTISNYEKDMIKSFWLGASERVEALRRIDQMRDDIKWGYRKDDFMGDDWLIQRERSERSIRNLRRRCKR